MVDLARKGFSLPCSGVTVTGGRGVITDWDSPLTHGDDGDVTTVGTISIRLFLGDGGMNTGYNLRSGLTAPNNNNGSNGDPTPEQRIAALNFTDAQQQYVTELTQNAAKVQNQYEDLKKRMESQAQMLKSLQEQVANAQSAPVSPPARPEPPFTISDQQIDGIMTRANQEKTLESIAEWMVAVGDPGQYALGHYFPTIMGRVDYPMFLSFEFSKFKSIDSAMRADHISRYIHTHNLRLVPAKTLRESFHQRQPVHQPPPPPPSRPHHGMRPMGGNMRFSQPFSPYNPNPPPPSTTNPLQSQLQQTLQMQQRQMDQIQRQLQSMGGGTNSELRGRSFMMNSRAPNPGFMDPSAIYNPMNQINAKDQLDDFLRGKSSPTFSLSALRRVVAPGCGTFNPKDPVHIDEIIKGIIWRLNDLFREKKIDATRYDTVKGELQQCSSSFAKIKSDELRKSCAEAWQRGIVNQRSFVGIEFMSLAVTSIHNQFGRGNGTRPRTGGETTARCHLCKQVGHWKKSCPYRNGKLVPIDFICEPFQTRNCSNKRCNKAHICSRCRSVHAQHSLQDCTRDQ